MIKQSWKLGTTYFLKTKFYDNQIFLNSALRIGATILNFLFLTFE